jgi:hypothetical protein
LGSIVQNDTLGGVWMTVFPIAYFGNIAYYKALLQSENLIFSLQERYVKQSFRNRCEIYGANGKLTLSVPVIKTNGARSTTADIAIAYAEDWQKVHWRSITSAYGKSPFFIHFEDDVRQLIFSKYQYLFELNVAIISMTFKWLHIQKKIQLDLEIENKENLFLGNDVFFKSENLPVYHQVFEEKFGFLENLSVLDLIFNEGLNFQQSVFQ